MYMNLTTLIDRLDSPAMSETDVNVWGCPVPYFGDPSHSVVATVGLNPSNREFVDERGFELQENARRFHTLASLGISTWSEVDVRHLRLIGETCAAYFDRNPYDRWFKTLEGVIAGAGVSYYDASSRACHLDVIPYATVRSWAQITSEQRSMLLTVTGDNLGLLLRDSAVKVLILNGRSVVDHIQEGAGITLESEEMPDWSLGRGSKPAVAGFSYKGVLEAFMGIDLDREILVLGFNHNLQSSFGVTTAVINSIRDWISESTREVFE